MSYVGLVPAAGRAKRLGELPHSKEVLPLTAGRLACDCLLQGFKHAGIRQVHWVIRSGKWDIPENLQSGEDRGLQLCYHVIADSPGTPFSLAQALPFVSQQNIALGFPDVQFYPLDVFTVMSQRQQRSGADIVLGCFPVSNPRKFDMVGTDSQGCVTQLDIKPQSSSLRFTWVLALWKPEFSAFMLGFLANQTAENIREIFVGTVFQAAMRAGFRIEAELFESGRVLDIGTPDDFDRAADFFAEQNPAPN